jgi:hypothetical protein
MRQSNAATTRKRALSGRKSYEKPAVRKLTPEQAKRLLQDDATRGGRDAKKSLDLIFPDLPPRTP